MSDGEFPHQRRHSSSDKDVQRLTTLSSKVLSAPPDIYAESDGWGRLESGEAKENCPHSRERKRKERFGEEQLLPQVPPKVSHPWDHQEVAAISGASIFHVPEP